MGATPQIIMQFAQCLDQFDGVVPGLNGQPGAARAYFIQQLFAQLATARTNLQKTNAALASLIPTIPVVNSVCGNGSERVGVTLVDNSNNTDVPPAAPTALDEAQRAALIALPLLPGKEQFAIQITAPGLQQIINNAWALLTVDNSRVNDDTLPDPKGPIELDSNQLTLAANVVKFQVKGKYHPDYHFPLAPFTATSVDTYSIQQIGAGATLQGIVNVASNPELSVDTRADEALADVIIGAETVLGFLTFAPAVLTKAYIDGQIAAGLAGVDFNVSLGALFQPVFISEILISGTDEKIVFNYSSVSVDAVNGILAFGNAAPSLSKRHQSVAIAGPVVVLQEYFVPGEHSASGNYTAIIQDIATPSSTVPVKWSGDAVFVQNEDAPLQVLATFNTQGAEGAHQIKKVISVAITDDSGLPPFKASLEVSVGIGKATDTGKPPLPKPKPPQPF